MQTLKGKVPLKYASIPVLQGVYTSCCHNTILKANYEMILVDIPALLSWSVIACIKDTFCALFASKSSRQKISLF